MVEVNFCEFSHCEFLPAIQTEPFHPKASMTNETFDLDLKSHDESTSNFALKSILDKMLYSKFATQPFLKTNLSFHENSS